MTKKVQTRNFVLVYIIQSAGEKKNCPNTPNRLWSRIKKTKYYKTIKKVMQNKMVLSGESNCNIFCYSFVKTNQYRKGQKNL